MQNAFTEKVLSTIDARLAEVLAPYQALFAELRGALKVAKKRALLNSKRKPAAVKVRAARQPKVETTSAQAPARAPKVRSPRTPRQPRERKAAAVPETPVVLKAVPPMIRRKKDVEARLAETTEVVPSAPSAFDAMLEEAQQRARSHSLV